VELPEARSGAATDFAGPVRNVHHSTVQVTSVDHSSPAKLGRTPWLSIFLRSSASVARSWLGGGGVERVKMEKDVTMVNFMSHSRNPGNDRNYIRHEGRGGEGPAIDEVKGEK
jgi:hypothetical protein